jgi:hypothetical protein
MIRVIICIGICIIAVHGVCRAGPASDPWDACCELTIVRAEHYSPPQRTIVDWHRQTLFTGRGTPGELVDSDKAPFSSWKRREIAGGISDFLKRNPGNQPEDFFRSLGMACASTDPTTHATHCTIEIPIEIRCTIVRIIPQGLVSVPEQLRGTFPAFLQMNVETSATRFVSNYSRLIPPFQVKVAPSTEVFIATYSQVIAPPGGHLCTR